MELHRQRLYASEELERLMEWVERSRAKENLGAIRNEAIALLAAKHHKFNELKQMIAIGTEQIQRGEVTDGETVFN